MSDGIILSVFTKPWTMPLPELGKFVSDIGFGGIELPVRPGYQVEPDNVVKGLSEAAKVLGDFGVKITSIAGEQTEAMMEGCANAGVPVIRICVGVGPDGYMATEKRLQNEFDALVPKLAQWGVTLGVQNHSGNSVCNAMGLRHLIEKYDPKQIAAIWCAGHNALKGEDPEIAIDIVWDMLSMVFLKNAIYVRENGPEAEVAEYYSFWTSGRQGLSNWPKIIAELKRRNYKGCINLNAEYSDDKSVVRLVKEDIAFAKELLCQ